MKDLFVESDRKIVVIGGGTGSFTLLSALKDYSSHLVAIVNMVDDGDPGLPCRFALVLAKDETEFVPYYIVK